VTKDELWKQWDTEGTPAARAHIVSDRSSPESRDWTREWMYRKQETQQAAADDERRQLSYRALAASEQSSHEARDAALASQRSADVARRSAFWTMVAALVSLLGILVNAAVNLGWLDWARHVAR
jgi:hypothetical protein